MSVSPRFRVLGTLGEGASSVVERAYDTLLGFDVALKTLRVPGDEPLFRREFSLLADLDHPNLGRVYDLVRDEGRPKLVMELLPGEDLGTSGRVTEPERLRHVARCLASALSYLHAHDVVHADVKPSNVRVTPDGRVVLVDLGLGLRPGLGLPWVGVTPAYAPPEAIDDTSPSPGWDAWALGLVLLELASGGYPKRPFATVPGALGPGRSRGSTWTCTRGAPKRRRSASRRRSACGACTRS